MASPAMPTASKSAHQHITLRHLWLTGLLIMFTAAVADLLIAKVAKSLFTVASTFTPLQPVAFVSFTLRDKTKARSSG